MNEEGNESIFVIGMWSGLVQMQNPAGYLAAPTGGRPLPITAPTLARQHDLKAMAATLKESQQVISGRFKIDAILLYHLALLGNS